MFTITRGWFKKGIVHNAKIRYNLTEQALAAVKLM